MDYITLRGKFIRRMEEMMEVLKGRSNVEAQTFVERFCMMMDQPEVHPCIKYATVSLDNEKMISYPRSADDSLDIVEPDSYDLGKVYDYSYRRRAKPTFYFSKVIKRSLFGDLKDSAVNLISEVWGMICAKEKNAEVTFEIYRGEGVYRAYDVASSCMRGSNAIKFYAENEEHVGVLVAESANYKARALIWNTDQGDTVVDRIYPNDSPLIEEIKSWAFANGYYVRKYQFADDNAGSDYEQSTFQSKNNRGGAKYKWSITMDRNDNYPYVDSFPYAREDKDHTILFSYRVDDEIKYLTSTQNSDPFMCYCESCSMSLKRWKMTKIFRGYSYDLYCESCVKKTDVVEYDGRLYKKTYMRHVVLPHGGRKWVPQSYTRKRYGSEDCIYSELAHHAVRSYSPSGESIIQGYDYVENFKMALGARGWELTHNSMLCEVYILGKKYLANKGLAFVKRNGHRTHFISVDKEKLNEGIVVEVKKKQDRLLVSQIVNSDPYEEDVPF